MQIHTHLDDEQEDDRSGLVKLESVALRLTPFEARDLRFALDGFLAQQGKWSEDWHDHIEAWDRSCEIVLLPDFEGISAEPSFDERVEAHLTGSGVDQIPPTCEVASCAAGSKKRSHRNCSMWSYSPSGR